MHLLALRRDRGAEHRGEPVDVGARALLGDRDQQDVVLAAPAPGFTPCSWQRATTLSTGALELHGELAHDRLRVQRLDAVERRQRLARVVRALQQQLAELDEPVLAQPVR